MTYSEFISSLEHDLPPANIHHCLEALWHDAKNKWSMAHDLVDGPSDKLSARVHAFLHRKEGDLWNADFWYRRSGESRPDVSLEEEWEFLVKSILEKER